MTDELLTKPENSLSEIKAYLSSEGQPIENNEFTEFWRSLTAEEKLAYKTTELK